MEVRQHSMRMQPLSLADAVAWSVVEHAAEAESPLPFKCVRLNNRLV